VVSVGFASESENIKLWATLKMNLSKKIADGNLWPHAGRRKIPEHLFEHKRLLWQNVFE